MEFLYDLRKCWRTIIASFPLLKKNLRSSSIRFCVTCNSKLPMSAASLEKRKTDEVGFIMISSDFELGG